MRIGMVTVGGIAAAVVAIAPASGNAQSCAPADTLLTPALNDMRQLVVSTHPTEVAARQRLGIPTVDPSEVTVVSDKKVCDKVLAAFKSSLESGIPQPPKLIVMKIGTAYVALYPESSHQVDIYRVMSNTYAILSRFAK